MIDTPRKPATTPAAPARSGESAPQPATSADRDAKPDSEKPAEEKRIERYRER
jgi:hypothetical protein